MFKIGDLIEHFLSKQRGLVIDLDDDGDPIVAFFGEPIEKAEAWVGKDFEVI